MITLVRLVNWRAYGEVEIQLEAGTTFLIGMNGVGKTSFLEAVRFAFDRTAKGNAEFIRKGTRTASVEVVIKTEDGTASLKRTVSLGTKTKPLKTPTVVCDASIDGKPATEDALYEHLEENWGADVGFVSRTAFLDTDVSPGATDNELRTHLCRAYKLDLIEENVRLLDDEIKRATKEADTEYRAGEDLEQLTRGLQAKLNADDHQTRSSSSGLRARTPP